jgi:hypothetical protein
MRNENNDFELNEVKRVIVHLIKEIRERVSQNCIY